MSCRNLNLGPDEDCAEHCCLSMFGNPRETIGASVIGFDVLQQEVVLPADHEREYWAELSRAERLVCFDCLGAEHPLRRVLVYCESSLGVPYFRHRPGESPEGDGGRGESFWHQTVKDGVARWAEGQPLVQSARKEWTTPSGRRRTDVGVQLSSGRRFAIEIQYSPISEELHAQRQADYQADGITPIWFYSIDLAEPRWAGKDLTFGVRLGAVDSQNHTTVSYIELGVPFTRPRLLDPYDHSSAEDFLPYANPECPGRLGVLWTPLHRAHLTDHGVGVSADPVETRRQRDLPAAATAAQRHNADRPKFPPLWTRLPRRKLETKQPPEVRKRIPGPTDAVCVACGDVLDSCLKGIGRHVLC